jgi:hypothetical protein
MVTLKKFLKGALAFFLGLVVLLWAFNCNFSQTGDRLLELTDWGRRLSAQGVDFTKLR